MQGAHVPPGDNVISDRLLSGPAEGRRGMREVRDWMTAVSQRLSLSSQPPDAILANAVSRLSQ